MTRVAFLVNGDPESAIGLRAKEFAIRLQNDFSVSISFRSTHKILSALRFLWLLMRMKPRVSYVFDMGYSGVLAGIVHKYLSGGSLFVDTGDAIYELARNSGSRGKVGLLLTRLLESASLRLSDVIVVRGSFHEELLAARHIRCQLVHDGVDTRMFRPSSSDEIRRKYGLDGVITLGVVGSSVWSEKLQSCYGMELVEVIGRLRQLDLRGLLVGDGTGIPHLKRRCRKYGIEDRVVFVGRVPYAELPGYINAMDICFSTQTNDLAGKVRTTAKLPLYMACGRYVLASKVGEAALVLPDEMLVDYEGCKDEDYYDRLAARVEQLIMNPDRLAAGMKNVDAARATFEYSKLAEKVAEVIRTGSGNS